MHQYQQNEPSPLTLTNHICSVMVSMLISSAIDHGAYLQCYRSWVEPRCVQTKDCNIGICCFSAKHTALRRKSKDWLAQNQNNVSRGELHIYPQIVVSVSWHYKIQLNLLV